MPDGPRESAERAPTGFASYLDSIVPALYPSHAALARAIGVSASTITRWRQGHTPQVPALYALASATGIEVERLFRIAGHGRPPSGRVGTS